MANFGRQLDSLNKLKELLTKAEENGKLDSVIDVGSSVATELNKLVKNVDKLISAINTDVFLSLSKSKDIEKIDAFIIELGDKIPNNDALLESDYDEMLKDIVGQSKQINAVIDGALSLVQYQEKDTKTKQLHEGSRGKGCRNFGKIGLSQSGRFSKRQSSACDD